MVVNDSTTENLNSDSGLFDFVKPNNGASSYEVSGSGSSAVLVKLSLDNFGLALSMFKAADLPDAE